MRVHHRTTWGVAGWLALGLLLLAPSSGGAQGAGKAGAAHKAAYLRHIADLTSWPEGSLGHGKSPIVIGVFGEDDSGVVALLEQRIRGKGLKAQNRAVVLRRLAVDTAATELGGCHLVFVPRTQASHWPELRQQLEDRSIVTVSDIEGFSRADGMIEFVFDAADSRVSMHIDLAAVHKARLRLSSKLLGLKRGVKIVRSPGEGEA
jgi:hypothetical protein